MQNAEQQFLDHYCERLAPGYWGEPLNLISNLAFIVAGVLVWRYILLKRDKISGRIWDFGVLTGLLFAIGIGSGLWHLLANSWSLKADTIPILLFISIYLLSCLFRVFSLSIVTGIVIFVFYHFVNLTTQLTIRADFLNGSIFYLPSWLFLSGIVFFAWKLQLNSYKRFVSALALFSISLIFRTMDLVTCNSISFGTHFIWHLLNAVTLYILMQGLIDNTLSTHGKYQS